MEEGDDDEFLDLWRKSTCKYVSTPTLKSVFERCNKECEIGVANISCIGIDV
jgi:hypothetical protein